MAFYWSFANRTINSSTQVLWGPWACCQCWKKTKTKTKQASKSAKVRSYPRLRQAHQSTITPWNAFQKALNWLSPKTALFLKMSVTGTQLTRIVSIFLVFLHLLVLKAIVILLPTLVIFYFASLYYMKEEVMFAQSSPSNYSITECLQWSKLGAKKNLKYR